MNCTILKQVVRHHPFLTTRKTEKLSTSHEEDAPANQPGCCLILAVNFCEESDNLIPVPVKSGQPCFCGFLVVDTADPPVLANVKLVLKIKQEIVTRHQPACKEVLRHPIGGIAHGEWIGEADVREDMDKQERIRF